MPHRLALSLLLSVSTLNLLSVPAYPHGGGLDQYGCHHNRTQGGYHCHRGVFRGSMFDSKFEMLQHLEQAIRSTAKEKEAGFAVVFDFSGKVVGVADGNTITTMHNGVGEKIRLNGIDCPEKRQAFGTKAKQFTSRLVFGETVTVHVKEYDQYDRTVADVTLPDGRNLNHELVKAGMCWWYRKYAPEDEVLKEYEHEAREAKRGLWVDPDPVPPWEWRRMKRNFRQFMFPPEIVR